MANPLLSSFELAGQQIDIRDSASFELATAAKQAADGMIQAIYDKDSKTITLQKQLSGDGVHTYDAGTLTI